MKNLIDKLIEEAGFSKTYEHDRLQSLVKLTVQYCLEKHTTDLTTFKARLIQDFNIKQ